MATLHKVYRFQMRPTRAQEEAMLRMAGARRFVYNWGLARRREHYAETGKTLSYFDQCKEVVELKRKPETLWLKEMVAQSLYEALRDVDRAYKGFFGKRTRLPKFKSKKRVPPSFRVTQDALVVNGKVWVPKIGWVKIRQSQSVDCKTKSAAFKRNALGKWHVTLTAEFEMPDVPLSPADPVKVIGVDLGLKDFVVLSTGERIAPPKFYRKLERRLAKAQRRLSRRQKGSKNRDKARLAVAKIHQKIANQRNDFIHKLTTSLVETYDGICIEDLSLKGMMKTKLSKSAGDAALGEFRRQLEYKTIWNRKHLAVIDRWFPSSKLHGACGARNDALTLSDRTWLCACGDTVDRDLNAAQNIRTEGLKQIVAVGHTETVNACGGSVRRPRVQLPVKQESFEPYEATQGIPTQDIGAIQAPSGAAFDETRTFSTTRGHK